MARDFRPALPELRPIGNARWLAEPSFFLDQLRPAGLLQTPVEVMKAPDWSFSSNEEVWGAVLSEQVRASRVVSLNGFYLSEWIPRSPGVFHTALGAQHRSSAMSRIVEEPYAHELAWIDHANVRQFEREVYGRGGAFKYMRIFDPYGKALMLRGGVGCIRLRKHDIDGESLWLMSASSSRTAHEGFPLAVPDALYQDAIDRVASDGLMYCISITGTLRHVPDFLGDLYESPDVPPVYLQVEEIRPGRRLDDDDVSQAMVSVAVSFESQGEQLGPRGMVYATYVTFFPGVKGSLQLRRDWLRDVYVGERYQGKVISDFDEQVPRFGDVPLGLIRVFDGTLDADEISVSHDYRVNEALGRYRRTLHIHGDIVLGGKNVDESTVINIEHSTVHGAVAKTIQDSFNTVSAASPDPDVKTVLGDLHKAVLKMLEEAELKGQLTEEEEAAVARDLESLSKEAVAASPRRKWYQLSAESLKEAARKLDEIGRPVLDTTARLLAILG